jgi:hypothetical protein
LILPVLAAALAAACDSSSSPTATNGVSTIRSTTSFGFCLGYCRTTLDVSSNEFAFVEEGTRSTDVTPRRRTGSISSSEWESLAGAVDRDRVQALPDVIGCPDCADGGAESIEIHGEGWRKTVTFEFGANVPELQPLLDRVRALRERVRP